MDILLVLVALTNSCPTDLLITAASGGEPPSVSSPATKKEPLLEVDPVIADKILFAGDPGKIEAERPRLAPSAPAPSSEVMLMVGAAGVETLIAGGAGGGF